MRMQNYTKICIAPNFYSSFSPFPVIFLSAMLQARVCEN